MIYLLAKYTLLFALATFLGFALGHWWSRRKLIDVSESWAELKKAADGTDDHNWNRLWQRLDALPEPKDVDLSGLHLRLDKVAQGLASLPQPQAVDLAPVEERLDALDRSVGAIPVPVIPKAPDLQPIAGKLADIEHSINAIPAPPKPVETDLSPLREEIATLRTAVRELMLVEPAAVDFTPVRKQITSVEERIRSIPAPQAMDLTPIDKRLNDIETKLSSIDRRFVDRPVAKPRRERTSTRKTNSRKPPRILSAALYGNKDDLKKISGVGPKLEKVLNENGVYYFWQVASWNASDVEVIDEKLENFKGRISRDDWITQARRLKGMPEAARMPQL